MKRKIQQKLVLNKKEKQIIRDMSEHYGLSQSELLRSLIKNEAIRLNMWPTPVLLQYRNDKLEDVINEL